MKFEKSAGAVIFREVRIKNKESREYLLLAYPSIEDKNKIYWGFPKGHVDGGESELETARREIKEETGFDEYSFLEGFKEKEKYMFKREGEFINKTSVYFLAQTTQEDVTISPEHVDYKWSTAEEAVKQLSFKESKKLLQKVEDFLNGKSLSPQLNLGF